MRRQFVLIAILTGLLPACAPQLQVRSHAYDLSRVPDRMLVVQRTGYSVPKPKESNEFKSEFSALLAVCGIPSAFAVNADMPGQSIFAEKVNPNADVETDKINDLKPTFVFTLKELTATTQGTVTTIDLEAIITDTARNKQIWRANGFVRRTPLLNRVTFKDLAQGFVDKMRADGILRSCPAAGSMPAKAERTRDAEAR